MVFIFLNVGLSVLVRRPCCHTNFLKLHACTFDLLTPLEKKTLDTTVRVILGGKNAGNYMSCVCFSVYIDSHCCRKGLCLSVRSVLRTMPSG